MDDIDWESVFGLIMFGLIMFLISASVGAIVSLLIKNII